MSDEQVVKERYPKAYAHSPMGGWWYIDISRNTPMLGEGRSEEAAWASARFNLKQALDSGAPPEAIAALRTSSEPVESPEELPDLDITSEDQRQGSRSNRQANVDYAGPISHAGHIGCRERQLKQCIAENNRLRAVPVEERTQDNAQNLRYATQIAEYLHKNCYSEVTQWKPISGDLFGVLMQIDNMCTGVQRKPIPEERTAEMEQWVAVPNEQGWWWHWDGDKEHVPFMYSVLTSLSRKINREFIGYPDSRWCCDIGGLWLKAKVPRPPVDHIEGKPK